MIIYDVPLVPDPDADQAMGPRDVSKILDQDIRGSRLLVSQVALEPVDKDGVRCAVIRLRCSFQPSKNARFTYAILSLDFVDPADSMIIDLQPGVVLASNPLEFTLGRLWELGLSAPSTGTALTASTNSEKRHVSYPCLMHGTGEGSCIATWVFEEHSVSKDGIGRQTDLAIVVRPVGKLRVRVTAQAELKRTGLPGVIDAVRSLMPSPDFTTEIVFDIPEQTSFERLRECFRMPTDP